MYVLKDKSKKFLELNKISSHMSKENKQSRNKLTEQDTINQLIKDRKFQELMHLYQEKYPDRIKVFTKLKFVGLELSIGDCVMMQENEFNSENFAAKIKQIVCLDDFESTKIPLVQVQWYGSREDVIIPEKYLNCISENELFLSTLVDFRAIDCIKRIIRVLTFQQYETLDWEEEYVFFSRAGYNHQNYEVSPAIQKWPKSCLCRMPVNPDQKYVLCDRCFEWYHMKCVGQKEEELQQIKFICPKCK